MRGLGNRWKIVLRAVARAVQNLPQSCRQVKTHFQVAEPSFLDFSNAFSLHLFFQLFHPVFTSFSLSPGLSARAKHITSQDNFLIGGRSECRKGLSESVKVVENCSCQTMIFKASAQKDATEFSKEK
jgi:hypothetical protein